MKTELERFLSRRQNIIYYGLVVIGIFSLLIHDEIGFGAAFIIGGFVGLVMSFLTMDIGDSIKKKIDDLNDTMVESFKSIEKSNREILAVLVEIKDVLIQMNEKLTRMDEKMDTRLTSIDTRLTSIDTRLTNLETKS